MKLKYIAFFVLGILLTLGTLQLIANRISKRDIEQKDLVIEKLIKNRNFMLENITNHDSEILDLTTNKVVGEISITYNGENSNEFLLTMASISFAGKDAIDFDFSFKSQFFTNIVLRPIQGKSSFFFASDLLDGEIRIVINEMTKMKDIYHINDESRFFLVTIMKDNWFQQYYTKSNINESNGLSLTDRIFAGYFKIIE